MSNATLNKIRGVFIKARNEGLTESEIITEIKLILYQYNLLPKGL